MFLGFTHHIMPYLNQIASASKIIVIFDASNKSSNGSLLNDLLLVGLRLQEDLFSVLLRFRKHAFAFTADIKQIFIKYCHQHHFFWNYKHRRNSTSFRYKHTNHGPVILHKNNNYFMHLKKYKHL